MKELMYVIGKPLPSLLTTSSIPSYSELMVKLKKFKVM